MCILYIYIYIIFVVAALCKDMHVCTHIHHGCCERVKEIYGLSLLLHVNSFVIG